MAQLLTVEVWGDLACFTQVPFKVERVSYPVMTPAAARGILESIFWKPEFSWQVREIWVLRPIRFISILRNEVQSRQSDRSARSWARNGGGYFAEEDRAQRHTLALRDVRYVIKAEIRLRAYTQDPVAKYREQFIRRVSRGQSFQQPYLGCREFVASFGEPNPDAVPIDVSLDLGRMLFDQQFVESPGGDLQYWTHSSSGRRLTRGRAEPKFFKAQLRSGVLRIPLDLYEETMHHAT